MKAKENLPSLSDWAARSAASKFKTREQRGFLQEPGFGRLPSDLTDSSDESAIFTMFHSGLFRKFNGSKVCDLDIKAKLPNVLDKEAEIRKITIVRLLIP